VYQTAHLGRAVSSFSGALVLTDSDPGIGCDYVDAGPSSSIMPSPGSTAANVNSVSRVKGTALSKV